VWLRGEAVALDALIAVSPNSELIPMPRINDVQAANSRTDWDA